jgi:hypothetical protein
MNDFKSKLTDHERNCGMLQFYCYPCCPESIKNYLKSLVYIFEEGMGLAPIIIHLPKQVDNSVYLPL